MNTSIIKNRRNTDSIKVEKVVDNSTHSVRDNKTLLGLPVSAKMQTDDLEYVVEFDARPFLEQANDSEIRAIIEAAFCRDYATDKIAEWECHVGGNKDIEDAFNYLAKLRKSNAYKYRENFPVSFECSINPPEMLRWLGANRTMTAAAITM